MPRTHKFLPRLFVDAPLAAGGELELEPGQVNHLITVLRRRQGDRCVLFNGSDGAFLAELTAVGKKSARVTLIEQSAPQTPQPDLWFGFAPIKRLDYQVQKATEMGAGVLQPVITRNVQSPRIRTDKVRANVIEAAQQCEVIAVPAVAEPIRLEALIADWRQSQGERVLVFCDEESASSSPLDAVAVHEGRSLGLLIGPEGGFTAEEREVLLAQDFVCPISLGPRILRADTATVAALAIIQAVAGDW
ncbi:16S rRNA (uracil(1498)-N(3))-methyltransferase [Pelagibacterium montanilacus]|uniref:16S rRNA (uracil(1498)-N(3))-methyltransferase n=1 Tax=Pelagibacterium montanilacus TaxID=2185280 RepID=UPI000F8EB956|nr:16S rRNA (uracil(1498)-N(3))-methyltransferase [Pelagibacterium montanilacus]